MRFAILGEDPRLTTLGNAAVRLGHEIVWNGAGEDTNLTFPAPSTFPTPPTFPTPSTDNRDEPWERLLDRDLADIILVGYGTVEDRRADQLRMFIQAGVPTLSIHPVFHSMLTYFELEMMRDETKCLMQHYTPGAYHPLLRQLRRMVTDAEELGLAEELGQIEQVVFERTMTDRRKEEVYPQLVQDLDLVSRVVGNIHCVATLKVPDVDTAYGNLSVQMSTSADLIVRWSVSSPASKPSGCIRLVGRDGQATLQMPEDLTSWSLEHIGEGGRTTVDSTPNDWDDAADAIRRIVSAVESQQATENQQPTEHQQSNRGESTWQAAARTVEVADAIERSMLKGRTIELHFEQFSEQSTFKGLMTSLGCGLLIAALCLVLVAGLIGDAFDLPWAGGWHFVLLAVLVIFLLLQLIPRIVFGQTSDDP